MYDTHEYVASLRLGEHSSVKKGEDGGRKKGKERGEMRNHYVINVFLAG